MSPTVRYATATVEADACAVSFSNLNSDAAQLGTRHLNSARDVEKRSVRFPRIIFRLNGRH